MLVTHEMVPGGMQAATAMRSPFLFLMPKHRLNRSVARAAAGPQSGRTHPRQNRQRCRQRRPRPKIFDTAPARCSDSLWRSWELGASRNRGLRSMVVSSAPPQRRAPLRDAGRPRPPHEASDDVRPFLGHLSRLALVRLGQRMLAATYVIHDWLRREAERRDEHEHRLVAVALLELNLGGPAGARSVNKQRI